MRSLGCQSSRLLAKRTLFRWLGKGRDLHTLKLEKHRFFGCPLSEWSCFQAPSGFELATLRCILDPTAIKPLGRSHWPIPEIQAPTWYGNFSSSIRLTRRNVSFRIVSSESVTGLWANKGSCSIAWNFIRHRMIWQMHGKNLELNTGKRIVKCKLKNCAEQTLFTFVNWTLEML